MPLPELLGSALEGQAHTKIHIRKETLCASIAQEEKEKEEKKKRNNLHRHQRLLLRQSVLG